MHELSIATGIVSVVVDNLSEYPGAKVRVVKLTIGAYAGIEIESLRFCFPLAAQNTAVQDAKLEITTLPLRITCRACLVENNVTALICPECKSGDVSVIAGRELEVSSIELDTCQETTTQTNNRNNPEPTQET